MKIKSVHNEIFIFNLSKMFKIMNIYPHHMIGEISSHHVAYSFLSDMCIFNFSAICPSHPKEPAIYGS